MSQAPTMHAVVITGVSSGIGYETAKLALERGAQVFGSVRRREDADRLAREFGERFTALLFDVRDERAVRAEAERVRAALGGRTLSGLVNNVGTAIPGPLLLQPVEEIRAQIEIDLGLGLHRHAGLRAAARRRPRPCPARPGGSSTCRRGRRARSGSRSRAPVSPPSTGSRASRTRSGAELQLFGIDVIIVAPGAVCARRVWSKIEAADRPLRRHALRGRLRRGPCARRSGPAARARWSPARSPRSSGAPWRRRARRPATRRRAIPSSSRGSRGCCPAASPTGPWRARSASSRRSEFAIKPGAPFRTGWSCAPRTARHGRRHRLPD